MIKRFNKKGFSLVELLVVITIIAILSVVAYTAVAGNTVKARDARRKQDLTTMQQAFEIYYVKYAKYPNKPLTSGPDAETLGQIPKAILSQIPVDPGTMKRSYLYNVVGSTYQLAATLENEGGLSKYEAYVVGNSDNGILSTSGDLGRYFNGTKLAKCTNGRAIVAGTIGNDDLDGLCVPYDPLTNNL